MSGRAVVTGIGIVSCLGVDLHHAWKSLMLGKSGIKNLLDTFPEINKLPCHIGGLVPIGAASHEYQDGRFFEKAELRNMSLASKYALTAAKLALEHSNMPALDDHQLMRSGVCIGSGMADLQDIYETGRQFAETGQRRVSPHFIQRNLLNMPAGLIAQKYKLRGITHSVSTACATGLHAIGDAFNFIRLGYADMILCGGTEANLSPLSLAGFSSMRALTASFNDSPESSSRPFDKDRSGFVMSDGSAVLVLESLEHAQRRDAIIIAEVLGYGLSGDAYHSTSPHPDGLGAKHCMLLALREAKVEACQIGYINAHATSTPLGDHAEALAIAQLDTKAFVSSTKGATGHLLGAAGAIEAAFTCMAVDQAIIPHTCNCQVASTSNLINYVLHEPREWNADIRIGLTNSFGFGGTNASLCISNYVSK